MSRVAILVEIDADQDDFDEGFTIRDVSINEVRQYDMSDHDQCAIQFFREMVMQDRIPDPGRQRLIVIGGDTTVTTLEDILPVFKPIPVSRVPFTVWKPVPPPPTPMWTAVRV